MQNSKPYTFTQEPVGVKTRKRKKKYRDPFEEDKISRFKIGNLMHDRRVFRGNTYAQQVIRLTEEEQETLRKKNLKSRKRKKQPIAKKEETLKEEEFDEVPPVEGRLHMEIQTDDFMEEITDRVIEKDIQTQTDPFMDRPESPIFIQSKQGEDRYTQIEEDLFNFDFEVEPLLQVLVGKTLEQSVLEVMKEEELKELEEQKRAFEQKRNQELVETQRLEAEERRKHEEIERRKEQERLRIMKEKEMKKKLQSRLYAKDFLKNLEKKVMFSLEQQGYFYDIVERTIEMDFLPWLLKDVNNKLMMKNQANKQLDNIIEGIF